MESLLITIPCMSTIETMEINDVNIRILRKLIIDVRKTMNAIHSHPYQCLVPVLKKDMEIMEQKLDMMERENGCEYCGAQWNEDCRQELECFMSNDTVI